MTDQMTPDIRAHQISTALNIVLPNQTVSVNGPKLKTLRDLMAEYDLCSVTLLGLRQRLADLEQEHAMMLKEESTCDSSELLEDIAHGKTLLAQQFAYLAKIVAISMGTLNGMPKVEEKPKPKPKIIAG